jgi:hypothetical protein
MAETEGGDKWRKIIVIVIIIIFAIAVLITFFVGLTGLKQFFTWLFAILLGLSILFLLMYVFWLIFLKKSYVDIPATYRKKLMRTAKLMKNNMLGDLWLSGDFRHNRIKLGKYMYLRITLPKQTTVPVENPQEHELTEGIQDGRIFTQVKKEKEVTEPVPVDCFVLVRSKIMDMLFGDPVFILVKPEDHNYQSIFNDVTINGFNLVPLDSQFYTIDRRNLDVDIIKGMATNYIREVVYAIFKDLDRLVKQAINLDQSHQKEKEKGLEFNIPQLGGGQK